MCATNKYPAKCLICGGALAPGGAVWGGQFGQGWTWLCGPCRDTAPNQDGRKIVETYLYQFANDAGGPHDARDQADYDIGERLVAAGRITEYAGPFGRLVTKETLERE